MPVPAVGRSRVSSQAQGIQLQARDIGTRTHHASYYDGVYVNAMLRLCTAVITTLSLFVIRTHTHGVPARPCSVVVVEYRSLRLPAPVGASLKR